MNCILFANWVCAQNKDWAGPSLCEINKCCLGSAYESWIHFSSLESLTFPREGPFIHFKRSLKEGIWQEFETTYFYTTRLLTLLLCDKMFFLPFWQASIRDIIMLCGSKLRSGRSVTHQLYPAKNLEKQELSKNKVLVVKRPMVPALTPCRV